MIKLSNLKLKNFLSHVDTEIPLEQYEGLVLIEGINSSGYYNSNGSGKSSILESIVYALTGNTLRGVSVNDIINRNYGKNASVSLDFTKDDKAYRVSRYRKDDVNGDSLFFYEGDKNISKRLNKDTQKSLEDTIDISYDVLISTMLLGEGLSSRFTQLSDPDKKLLIESTLNLNYDMNNIKSKSHNKLSSLKLNQSSLSGRIQAIREYSSLDVESAKKQLEDLLAKASEALNGIEQLKSSKEVLRENKENLESKINLLRENINKYDTLANEMHQLNQQILAHEQEIKNIDSTAIPHCTTCRQAMISAESKAAFKDTHQQQINKLSDRISEILSHLNALPNRVLLDEKCSQLITEIGNVEAELSKITADMDRMNSQYWTHKCDAEKIDDSIKKYNDSTSDISELEVENSNIEKDISKYDYFYKLFSPTGIIVDILSDAINYINSRLSAYSEILLEKDYRIEFNKGKISLVDKSGASYQSLSNGEKRRLDIAIQFSLHDYVNMYCNNSVDTLFLDEVLDTLDDTGIENIIAVLRLKLDYCKLSRIFVISHNSELKSYFDNIITIVKDGNGDSRIKS